MKEQPTFPKLLIATEAWPNGPGGGLAIIRQMLRDWPVDRLYWWGCFPDQGNFGQRVGRHFVAPIPRKLYPLRRWNAAKSWVLESFWVPFAVRHLRSALAEANPDVVWVIPHCWSIPPTRRVLPQTRIPFHVSVHDYVDVRGNVLRFGFERSQRFLRMADELYRGAATRDAICQPMLDDLRARTGSGGTICRAGLEQEDFDHLAAQPEGNRGDIRIAYAGTILVEKEFELFVQAMERMREKLPKPVWIDFYGDHSYRSRRWFNPQWMREHGNLPTAALSAALRECSWGFAPMGLTEDDPRYNRFSLPTKFVSYIAAGLPVITIGHPESSVVKMATAHRVGICVSDGDVGNLSARLLAEMSDPNSKLKYMDAIRRCAEVEFDARRMRKELRERFTRGLS